MTDRSQDVIADLGPALRAGFYINGDWTQALGNDRTELISPIDATAWTDAPLASLADIDRATAAARHAFDTGAWPALSPADRAHLLRRFAVEIERREPLLARLWTAQVGAPISFATMFVPTARAMLGYYADLLDTYEFEDRRPTWGGRGPGHPRTDRSGRAHHTVECDTSDPVLQARRGVGRRVHGRDQIIARNAL
jgi:acyl-CoA reductase-like NAD-dependent aldehyde dehydrogenase